MIKSTFCVIAIINESIFFLSFLSFFVYKFYKKNKNLLHFILFHFVF